MSTQQTVTVTGMTCNHCVMSVTEELRELAGVTDVAVDLRPGEPSPVTVTSDAPLADAQVDAAIAEAGFAVSR